MPALTSPSPRRPWLAAALALMLSACGGGDSDNSSRVSSVVGSMGLQRAAPAASAASGP